MFACPNAPVLPAFASLLPPARFLPFNVPFELLAKTAQSGGGGHAGGLAVESGRAGQFGEGGTVGNPCELPQEYMDALESAKQRLLDFQTSLQQLGAPGMCEEVQQAVHRRFREWLVKSGNMRQVQDLMALEAGRLPGQ
ncbi:hypothetical protein T492DRAFT_848096 [Pavlovales sp. CCMP2436]|nr:hypothetical protein T492DRAFT_848096 [Pavlovales sp. CCMP2436]